MEDKNYSRWDISLNTRCPHCKHHVNLLDYADFWDGRSNMQAIEHDTPRTTDTEVICPGCNEEFKTTFEY